MAMLPCILIALQIASFVAVGQEVNSQDFQGGVQPVLKKYCVNCHSGDDPAGEVDFAIVDASDAGIAASFELWGKAAELVADRSMPPEDEPQPTDRERAIIADWYQHTLVDSVEARPAEFQPHRLSATEYRNTLRSLFGFDLEVAVIEAEQTVTEKSLVLKLLPTDPPGKSGFRNDTHSNPLTTATWETYSYCADAALSELFSDARKGDLERLAGEFGDSGFTTQNAEQLLRTLIPRVYRRTVASEQLDAIMNSIRNAEDIVTATKVELKAALMSPAFLYRGLLMPAEDAGQQRVDDFELAERLSYFIWADMPDQTLLDIAKQDDLHEPATLHQQVERMLDSPKATSLATDFATQWLTLDEIDHVSDNPPYAVALKSQPIDFINFLFTDNRPLLELLDSRTTFVSPLLRKFYSRDARQLATYRKPKGVEIEIVPNQQIQLDETVGRGGLLTMPGVLAMNRGPILRGVWMLERILGEHLPDPPADVGQVQASAAGENVSFRDRFQQHRAQASCAICHDKIDPLGFALDGYDDGGKYVLDEDDSKQRKGKKNARPVGEIDTSGQLPTGEQFADFDELKQILLTSQRQPVIRNIVKRMLSYALCRKLEIFDQPTVEGIVEKLDASDGTYRDLVHEIVTSLPFQETIVSAP